MQDQIARIQESARFQPTGSKRTRQAYDIYNGYLKNIMKTRAFKNMRKKAVTDGIDKFEDNLERAMNRKFVNYNSKAKAATNG